jgi:hypothetical protein
LSPVSVDVNGIEGQPGIGVGDRHETIPPKKLILAPHSKGARINPCLLAVKLADYGASIVSNFGSLLVDVVQNLDRYWLADKLWQNFFIDPSVGLNSTRPDELIQTPQRFVSDEEILAELTLVQVHAFRAVSFGDRLGPLGQNKTEPDVRSPIAVAVSDLVALDNPRVVSHWERRRTLRFASWLA